MEDPFTRMSQNFFSFLSQIKQRGYVITTTQALSFSFFPPFSTTVVCVWSTVLLEFPNHLKEFPNLPTPMSSTLYLWIKIGWSYSQNLPAKQYNDYCKFFNSLFCLGSTCSQMTTCSYLSSFCTINPAIRRMCPITCGDCASGAVTSYITLVPTTTWVSRH